MTSASSSEPAEPSPEGLVWALREHGVTSIGPDDALRLAALWPRIAARPTEAKVAAITALVARDAHERSIARRVLPELLAPRAPPPPPSSPPPPPPPVIDLPPPPRQVLLAAILPVLLCTLGIAAILRTDPAIGGRVEAPALDAGVAPDAALTDGGPDARVLVPPVETPGPGVEPASAEPPDVRGVLDEAGLLPRAQRPSCDPPGAPWPALAASLASALLLGLALAIYLRGRARRARAVELAVSTGPRAQPRLRLDAVADPVPASLLAWHLASPAPRAPDERRELDPRATVEASTRAAGRIELRYMSRRPGPILLLVERGAELRWPFHADQIERALGHRGARVERAFFDGVPDRIASTPHGPALPLAQALAQYGAQSVVIFGEPRPGEDLAWARALPEAHVWLHPRPAELWSRAARELASHVRLRGIGEREGRAGAWIAADPPDASARALAELWSGYLGPEGFELLCVLAAADRAGVLDTRMVWWARRELGKRGALAPWERVERLWEVPGLDVGAGGAIHLRPDLAAELRAALDAMPERVHEVLRALERSLAALRASAPAESLGGARLRVAQVSLGLARPAERERYRDEARRMLDAGYGELLDARLEPDELGRLGRAPRWASALLAVAVTCMGASIYWTAHDLRAPGSLELVSEPHVAAGWPLRLCRRGAGLWAAEDALAVTLEQIPLRRESRGSIEEVTLASRSQSPRTWALLVAGHRDHVVSVGPALTLRATPLEDGGYALSATLPANVEWRTEPRLIGRIWRDGAWGGADDEWQQRLSIRERRFEASVAVADHLRTVALVGVADDGRPLYSDWVVLGPLVLEPFRQGCPPRTTAPFSRNDPLCEGECVPGTTRASREGALPAAHWRCQTSFGRTDIQRVSIEQGRLRWRVAIDPAFEQSTECECTPNVEPRPECPEGRARGVNGTDDAYCERSGAGALLVVREQEGRPQWEALLERPMGILLTSCECAPAGEAPPRQPPVPCSDPCPASRPDAGAVPPAPLENPLGLELPGNPFGAAPRAPRRSPEVALGGASMVGALDREVVQRVVRSHLEEVRLCYEPGLDRDANLAGVVEVSFVVDPTGTVPSAAVRRTTIDDPSVGECIRRAVLRWRFPHPRGGSVTINYPFVLRTTEP